MFTAKLSWAVVTYTWTGTTSTDWATNSNWSSSGGTHPGAASTDIVIINTTGANQPIVAAGSGTISIASITIGKSGSTVPSLTVLTGSTLSLSGSITFASVTASSTATLAGAGTINAASIAITATSTSAANTLTLVSSITALNVTGNIAFTTVHANPSKNGDATFNITGGTVAVTGTITTTNANSGNFSTLSVASGATLKLANTTAFSGLSATTTNTLTFSSGSTINYSGTTAQTVYAAIANSSLSGGVTYSNLTLSGSAIKTVPSGTLTVDGNFTNSLANDASDKLDVTTNSIPVIFGGTAQTINCGSGLGTTFKNITFSGTGIKTVSSGIMNITGNFTNSITLNDGSDYIDFTTNNTPVNFTGTTQTLAGGNGTGTTFKTLTFSGGGTKTMSGKFSIASLGSVTLSASSTLATGGVLTLNSDATGSATVANIPSGSSITGNVIWQRFMTGGTLTERGYRLISSAVNAAAGVYNLDFLKSSGSYLTGGGGTGNGWDAAGNPTLYLYRDDETPANYTFTVGNYREINKINNTNTYSLGTLDGTFSLPVGTGILYFFRGNNGVNPATVPNNITFSATGALNQGQITYKSWVTGTSGVDYIAATGNGAVIGFNLVGNPYASSIDWHTNFGNTTAGNNTGICCSTNLDNTIYIYNPVSKVYATYLNTSSSTGTAANGGSNIIPAGQGFFVHATTTGASIIFNESAKVTSQPGTLLLNAATPAVDQHLRLELAKDTVNKEETVLVFNSNANTDYVPGEDALYLQSTGEVSLSNIAGSKALAISQLPFSAQRQTIPLNVSVASTGPYQFNLTDITNIPPIFNIWLKDALLKDSVDIKNNPTYSFTVPADTTGTGSRFSLVISPDPTLAVQLLSFTGAKETGDVKLVWTAKNEANYTQYTLQRSTDGGKTFITLDSLTSASLGSYIDLDTKPATGQNQYRLKQVDINGVISYSSVVTIMYSAVSNNIGANIVSVYPNPASGIINLAIKTGATANASASYKITITSSAGIIVKTITAAQPNWQGDVSGLIPGTYFVQVTNAKDNTITGSSTFIKL